MTDTIPSDIKVGLSVTLYELFYVGPDFLSNLPPFGQKQRNYYSKFDIQKLNTVGRSLEWAVKNDSYPFNTIYPRHKSIRNELIVNFLEYTLNGLVESDLYVKSEIKNNFVS